jgi:hypothetical protein
MFADAVFNLPPSHARAILEEMIRRKLPVTWSAYMDIMGADREFMLLAWSAGCRNVYFSPDAFSQPALDGLRKGLRVRDIRKNLDLFTGDPLLKNINTVYCLFLNPPGETLAGLVKTLFFYLRARVLLRGRGTVFLNWIRMEPSIAMLQEAQARGLVPRDIDLLPDSVEGLENTFYSHPPLNRLDGLLTLGLRAQLLVFSALKRLLNRR